MSIECALCERDLRGAPSLTCGEAECPRVPKAFSRIGQLAVLEFLLSRELWDWLEETPKYAKDWPRYTELKSTQVQLRATIMEAVSALEDHL